MSRTTVQGYIPVFDDVVLLSDVEGLCCTHFDIQVSIAPLFHPLSPQLSPRSLSPLAVLDLAERDVHATASTY